METFAAVSEDPSDKSFIQYDASGKVIMPGDSYDPESQTITNEFKKPHSNYFNAD